MVEHITESLVTYYSSPKEERKAKQQQRKLSKQESSIPITNKWFGLLPVSIKFLYSKRKH